MPWQGPGVQGARSLWGAGSWGWGPWPAPGHLWASHTFIYEAALGLPEREAPPGSDPGPALSVLEGRPSRSCSHPRRGPRPNARGRRAW